MDNTARVSVFGTYIRQNCYNQLERVQHQYIYLQEIVQDHNEQVLQQAFCRIKLQDHNLLQDHHWNKHSCKNTAGSQNLVASCSRATTGGNSGRPTAARNHCRTTTARNHCRTTTASNHCRTTTARNHRRTTTARNHRRTTTARNHCGMDCRMHQ